MYTQQDYEKVHGQRTKRLWFLIVPMIFVLGGIIWSFIARIEWLTMTLTVLGGAVFIFVFCMFISPLIAYERHLQIALHGRTRVTKGTFKEMGDTDVLREGVRFYPLMISVGNPQDEEDDRLFYFDANLPRPDFKEGDSLTITAHDKYMTAYEKA